jgi:hypothetical protein
MTAPKAKRGYHRDKMAPTIAPASNDSATADIGLDRTCSRIDSRFSSDHSSNSSVTVSLALSVTARGAVIENGRQPNFRSDLAQAPNRLLVPAAGPFGPELEIPLDTD